MDFYWHICQALVTLPMMPDSLATPSLSSTFSLQEQLLKVSRITSIKDLLLDSRGFFIWNSDAIGGVQTTMHCRQGDYLSALLSPTEDDNRRRRLDWDLALVSKEDYTHTNTNPYCTGSSQITAILLVNVWTTKLPCLGEKPPMNTELVGLGLRLWTAKQWNQSQQPECG